jgi:hypothetical protein
MTHARLALVLLLVAAVGVATAAYLATLTNTETNYFEIGKNPVTIEEDFDGWDAKEVRLSIGTDENDVPSIVRAMVVPYILDGDGNYVQADLGGLSAPVGNEMVLGDITLVLDPDWADNWAFFDGYFYHRYVLYPEEPLNTTALLLARVVPTHGEAAFAAKYGDDAYVKVEVLADSLQAEGGAGAKWDVDVDMSPMPGTVAGPPRP